MTAHILLLHDGHPMAWNLAGALHRLGAAPALVDWTQQAAVGADGWDVVILAGMDLPPGPAGGAGGAGGAVGAGRAGAGPPADIAQILGDAQQPLLAVGRPAHLLAVRLGCLSRPSTPPRHGQVDLARHSGLGPLAGLPDPLRVMRYDSYLPADLPEYLSTEAWTEHGETLAWRHRRRPWWGVCFHPGSLFAGPSDGLIENLVSRGKEVLYAAP